MEWNVKISLRSWLVVDDIDAGMETGVSLLKFAVKDFSKSSFSAFLAKQKSDILFCAVINI